MNDILCYKIDDKGLYLEQTLVELDYPILYVCKDNFGDRYLALCVDVDEGYYLVASVENETLLKMLKSEITMQQVFKMSKKLIKVLSRSNNIDEDINKIVRYRDLPDEDLPQKGAYFKVVNNDVAQYINYLSAICSINNLFSHKIQLQFQYTKAKLFFICQSEKRITDLLKCNYSYSNKKFNKVNFVNSNNWSSNNVPKTKEFNLFNKEIIHGHRV